MTVIGDDVRLTGKGRAEIECLPRGRRGAPTLIDCPAFRWAHAR
jgi:hypothetical protein